MRISNIEWLKKRIGFIRKLGEQTARQRQIIDLLDNEAGLTEQERKLLHVLATAEKNDLQAQESERKQAVQKRIEGKKQRRERNHRLFLAAGLLIEAGLVDTKTGELCYKKDRIFTAVEQMSVQQESVRISYLSEHAFLDYICKVPGGQLVDEFEKKSLSDKFDQAEEILALKKENDWKFLFIWNAADGRKMLWDQAKAEAFSRENVLRVLEEECI